MMDDNNTMVLPRGTPITEGRFTPRVFEVFLLDTIFTEVLCCDLHMDCLEPKRKFLTAIGKLEDHWYLAQVASDDRTFEDVTLIQLQQNIIINLGRFYDMKLEV